MKTVRLQKELEKDLKNYAQKEQTTESEVIREVLVPIWQKENKISPHTKPAKIYSEIMIPEITIVR